MISGRALNLFQAALSLREAGNRTEAIRLLKKLTSEQPAFTSGFILLGLNYQETGSFGDAEKAFRTALSLEPENAEANQSLGLFLVGLGRLLEAAPYLVKHLSLDPGNPITLDTFIPALEQAGRLEEAEQVLHQSWQKTKDQQVAVRYVRFLFNHAQAEKACHFLTIVLAEHRPSPSLYVELALGLVIQEKYMEAVVALRHALELDPHFDRAWRGLSHCFTQLGQCDQALETAEQALAINPNHFRSWQAKADALLLAEKYAEADEAASIGIGLADKDDLEDLPALAVLYIQRFSALLKQSRPTEALKVMAQARSVLSKDARFYLWPIKILVEDGQLEAAWDILAEAQNNQLDAVRELYEIKQRILPVLGLQAYLDGKPAHAIHFFEEAHDLEPDNPAHTNTLGFLYTMPDTLDKADNWLSLTASMLASLLEDQHSLYYANLGYLRILQGRLEDARSAFQQALQSPENDGFLRVACVYEGFPKPDPRQYSLETTSTHDVARANLGCIEATLKNKPG